MEDATIQAQLELRSADRWAISGGTSPARPEKRIELARRLAWPALVLSCLLLYLAGADGFDLLTDDELRYAEAGRRMVESGDWLIPEYNGYPRYQKPIFFYWLQALSIALLGPSAWAARLPVALAGVAVVLMTGRFGQVLWGFRAGLWSGIVLALSVQMLLLSRMAMTDVVLLLFSQGGLTCFCRAQLETEDGRQRRWYRVMYLCLGLGVLTKGPIALMLPTAVIGPWLFLRGTLSCTIRRARLLEGIAIILAIAGPWYLSAHLATDGEFTRHFFLHENVGRFTSVVNTHSQPVAFYLLLLVPMTFPWCSMVLPAMRSRVRLPLRALPPAEAVAGLLQWQVLLVFVLFTFSRTKVWTYTLPAFPPLALWLGRWLAERWAASRPSLCRISSLVFAAFALASAVALHWLPLSQVPAEVRSAALLDAVRVCCWTLFGLGAVIVALAWSATSRVTLTALTAGTASWYLLVVFTLMPIADRVWKGPVREVARHVSAQHDPIVVTYFVHELGLNFHTGLRTVQHWREGSLGDLDRLLREDRPVFVLVDPKRCHELAGLRFHVWGRWPRFVLGANFLPPER